MKRSRFPLAREQAIGSCDFNFSCSPDEDGFLDQNQSNLVILAESRGMRQVIYELISNHVITGSSEIDQVIEDALIAWHVDATEYEEGSVKRLTLDELFEKRQEIVEFVQELIAIEKPYNWHMHFSALLQSAVARLCQLRERVVGDPEEIGTDRSID